MHQLGIKIERLKSIIESLRGPNGCPWDKKQTPQSFKSYLLEEAYELLEAIEQDNPEFVKEEMGDMFFQLLFICQLYEDREGFSLLEALDAISEKMIRRHPHVFGDETVSSEKEQKQSWNAIKAKEKKEPKSVYDLLSAVPKSFPALRRAQRISERAAHNGFDWENAKSAYGKFAEEAEELQQAMTTDNKEQIEEEIGDILFSLASLGRLTGVNIEEALMKSTEKFLKRFHSMETGIEQSGKKIRGLPTTELLEHWRRAKKSTA